MIQVCIPSTQRDFFDYDVLDLLPAIGSRVVVPFGKKEKIGIVIGHEKSLIDKKKLKPITTCLDEAPLLTEEILALCRFVSTYYQVALSEVMKVALPKQFREGKALLANEIRHGGKGGGSPVEREIPHCIRDDVECIRDDGEGIRDDGESIRDDGESIRDDVEGIRDDVGGIRDDVVLNQQQNAAVASIVPFLHQFHCFLLQGITGSGKTEVYLQIIEKVLSSQRQVLVLVPEIGLTPQLIARFQARLSVNLVALHSNLSDKKRYQAWSMIQNNSVQLVIGTRTSVFAPFSNLGLVVVDEEHDASYKQMDRVRYSARDIAIVRAERCNIPIILGTATPSLESMENSNRGKFTRLYLTTRALNSFPPNIQLIDIRNQSLVAGFAPKVLATIRKHLEMKNQVMVFINRRGFAPILLCQTCGWIADCHACDSHLTLHRTSNRLLCHHCGYEGAVITQCNHCQNTAMTPIGAGTERIAQELQSQFPDVAISRVDRDVISRKNTLDKQLSAMITGENQMIVGTQMLAKGHHFPNLTLVVILDADQGFYNQDFRSLERLGQLITQVGGRAGRALQPGEILIQTHFPEHPLLNLLIKEGYEPFATQLLSIRKQALLPPFYFVALIRAQHKNIEKVMLFLNSIKHWLSIFNLSIMGPAPAPLERKAHFFRFQLLIKATHRSELKKAITHIRHQVPLKKGMSSMQWDIDVDPIDLS